MSDVSQVPGLWRASNTGWHPPEQHLLSMPPSPPGTPSTYPYPTYPRPPSKPSINGFAVASLVLSILWLGGLGSVLAIIFGASARKQMARMSRAQRGEGLALAGFVIGFVGLGVALFAWLLAAVIIGIGDLGTGFPAAPVKVLHYGHPAELPYQSDLITFGISRITVLSVDYPVISQIPSAQPAPGTEFAVVNVQICAGPKGTQGLNESMESNLSSELYLVSGGSDTLSSPDAQKPGLDDIRNLSPGQCADGLVTFGINNGSPPTAVEYQMFVGTTYKWIP